jgi:ABC-type transport system involved in multi-copper enzyme maturation permease subunit
MSMFAVLARNETLKMTRFLPFRVTTLAFAVIMALGFASLHMNSRRAVNPRTFELPTAWNEVLGDPLAMAAIFFAVLLMLLVASEFTWRTARQNVIDGLSKEQWFAGKLLVVPMAAALFFTILIGLGGLIAALPPNPTAGAELVRAADLRLMGAFFLGLLGYGALALFFATTIRSTGSAIGVFFLYVVLLERLIAMAFQRIGGGFASAAEFLPTGLFNGLLERMQWDAPALAERVQRMAAAALEAGRPAPPPPELMDSTVLLAACTAWIAALVALSFVLFRKRDL